MFKILLFSSVVIHTHPPSPMEDIFALDPPQFPYPPPTGILVIFQLDCMPSGKNIYVKNVVAL